MNKYRFLIRVTGFFLTITLWLVYLFDRKVLFEMFDEYYRLEDSNNE